ncbi:hypothetical protein [Kangsaoukella pontilimi]|uniref:hypothetical protein n=1 Tax=Kangsaoukella pontilimi TaxID=2691042 RepID=UPI001D0ACAAD|nr:hypothetical protein [Kangsaoukella pontilimi]
MDGSFLLILLAIVTLGAVMAFALYSKKRTQDRLEDDDAPKSTLAADTPDHR